MKIFTFILGLFVVSISWGQTTIKPHIGVNYSLLSTDQVDYDDPGIRPGFIIGLGLKSGENWYVEPAVEWFGMNYELIHESSTAEDYKSIIQGLRVPIMGGYQIGANDDIFRLRLYVGPVMTFPLNITTDGGAQEVPVKDDLNSFLFGLGYGVGVDIWILYLEAGFQSDFTEFYQNTSDFGNGKNGMMFITLGVNLL